MPALRLSKCAIACAIARHAAVISTPRDLAAKSWRAGTTGLALALMIAAVGQVPVAAAAATADPRPLERGLPSVTVVPASEVGAAQLFAVAVAARRLYVATLSGLSVFDGAHWDLVPSARALYAVHATPSGRVIAGGPDMLVELRTGADGRRSLGSLVERLPADQRAVGDVRSVHAVGDAIFVVTDRQLILIAGTAVRVVDRWRSDPGRRGFATRDRLYVVSHGSVRAYAASAAPLEDAFTAYDVSRGLVTVVAEHPLAGLIVGVEGRGLFTVRDGVWREVGQGSGGLLRAGLTDVRVLDDGAVAVASAASGLIRLTPDLVFDGVIGRAEGLPSSHVESLAADQEGGLWASGTADLSRVDLASSITRIDARVGLEGTVNGVARFRDRLHVLTTSGLFALDHPPGSRLRAVPVAGVSARAWSAIDGGDHLLVATADGVFESRPTGARLVPGTARLSAYALAALADDPQRVLVGSRSGLSVLARDGDGWRFERHVTGAPRYVRSIVSRPGGVAYLGSTFDGVVRLSVRDPRPTPQPLSAGESTVVDVAGIIHVLDSDAARLATIDEVRHVLVPEPRRLPVPSGALRLAVDRSGALWLSGRGAAVVAPQASTPLPVLDASLSLQMLDTEPDGVVWVGGSSGLWRVASSPVAPNGVPPPTLEHVVVNGRLTALTGAAGATLALPHGIERLRLEFSPNTFAATAVTDFKLEPLDADWSTTRRGHAAEYTSLPAGTYRLRMRSTIGTQQAETTWAFSVRAPWYRTAWAYLLESASGVGLLVLVGRVRTRQLRRRAEELERAVVEKTTALQDANRRLAELAWRDELTGLFNRRRFEEALSEEWARAHRAQGPIALVLVDLDHFKALNDTLGHSAGDRALKAVAEVIQSCARRPGDVAARYGGDEFAVLLPGGRWERVHELAEAIRVAVEALALPHPRHTLDHVTVSVGVTAVDAPAQLEPTLVDAADRALYRAKAGGRNAVAA